MQPRPQTPAAQLFSLPPKKNINHQPTDMFTSYRMNAISSCHENWKLPFLSNVAAAAESNYSIAGDVSDCRRDAIYASIECFKGVLHSPWGCDYMTLGVVHVLFFVKCCVDLLQFFSLWSLLRSAFARFPCCTFCLRCISLTFLPLKSPFSLIHKIVLKSYLIPFDSNRLLLICSNFLWSPLCGSE